MKAADVYAAFAEYCSHATDDSRHVAIAHHQHVAARSGFDVKAINFRDAAFARLFAKTENCSRQAIARLPPLELARESTA